MFYEGILLICVFIRLIVKNNNDNAISSNGFGLVNNILTPINSEDFANTLVNRNEATITYQKRFDDKNKKLDFQLNYNNYNTDFAQKSFINPVNNIANASNQDRKSVV